MSILERIRKTLNAWCILCGASRRADNAKRVATAIAAADSMVAACSRLLRATRQAAQQAAPPAKVRSRTKVQPDAAFLQSYRNIV